MKEELRTFRITCDLCKVVEIHQSSHDDLPEGWESRFEYDFVFHYCKLCVKAMRTRGEI